MRAKEQNSQQFAADIALAYGSRLHRFLVKRFRAGEDAADMAQEVYLRLLRVKNPDLIRHPASYVYYIAATVAGQFGLEARRQAEFIDAELDLAASSESYSRADELPEREHAERELARLLSKLSVAHRTVLLLKKQEGLTNAEVAEKLHITPRQVKELFVEANAQLLDARMREQGSERP